MASSFHLTIATTTISPLLFLLLPLLSSAANDTGFDMGPEKQTHIHFFFHDIVSGRNPTAIRIAAAPNTTTTGFGALVMVDDPLTEGPETTSKLLGRAQGFYATASMGESALLMTMNFYFSDGDWKGSSLAIVGRNAVFSRVREMPVVGGSGQFRWAEGYALANTKKFDQSTGDATTEYDVYVSHRCADQSVCSSASAGDTPDGNTGGMNSSGVGRASVGFSLIMMMLMIMILDDLFL